MHVHGTQAQTCPYRSPDARFGGENLTFMNRLNDFNKENAEKVSVIDGESQRVKGQIQIKRLCVTCKIRR